MASLSQSRAKRPAESPMSAMISTAAAITSGSMKPPTPKVVPNLATRIRREGVAQTS